MERGIKSSTAKAPIPPLFNPALLLQGKAEGLTAVGHTATPSSPLLQLFLVLWCDQALTGDVTATAAGRKNSFLHVTGKDL